MARYQVDLGDVQRKPFTIGETRELSRIGGLTLGEMQAVERGQLGDLPVTAMVGIVYVLIRRKHPRFTEADMDGLSWEDIDFVAASDGNGDDGTADPSTPLPPLASGGGKRSRRSVSSGA